MTTPSPRRPALVVPEERSPTRWASVRARGRALMDWGRGPFAQILLFLIWVGTLSIVGARLWEEIALAAGAARAAAPITDVRTTTAQTVVVLFLVLAALPKLLMFLGALVAIRRTHRRRMAIAPLLDAVQVPIDGVDHGSPMLSALVIQSEEEWASEHVKLADVYVDRFAQHAGIYGFVTSASLAVAGMVLMSRALSNWVSGTDWFTTDIYVCLAVAVLATVLVTFARDFGRFLVRVASRDASAQLLAWSTRRQLAMLVFGGLVGALAVYASTIFRESEASTIVAGSSRAGIWVAGVLGGLVAFFGERAANALADRVGAMFGLPRMIRPVGDLTELDGVSDDDVGRLAEEGVDSVQALALASTARLFYNTNYSLERICDWQDQALLRHEMSPERARAFREQLSASGATEARRIAVHLLQTGREVDATGATKYSEEWDDVRKLLGVATNGQAVEMFGGLSTNHRIVRLLVNRWAVSVQIAAATDPAPLP